VLRSKFQVGLFENPYVDEAAAALVFDTEADRTLARRAAAESVVLLQNRGDLLPLDPEGLRRVAVIGPAADDRRLLQGDYHYPAHLEVVYEDGAADGATRASGPDPDAGEWYLPADGGAFRPGPHFVPHVTPLAGIRAAAPAVEVNHAGGCDVTGYDTSGIPEAARAAEGADVAVVFVGGRSGLTLRSTVGEARDASDLALTGVQQALVDAVVATGTPTVVVLMSGRVHAIPSIASAVPAVLQAWLPGEEGGAAIADVLFGRCEPAGRLPVSMPRAVGQVPVHHDYRSGGGRTMFWGDYVDGPTTPLYAFGHGLTYTSFEYGPLEVRTAGTTSEPVVLRVRVTNCGGRRGTEVVQLYVTDEVASVARPYRQLVGFARAELEPDATAAVTFEVDPSRLAFYDDRMRFVTEPGWFRFSVGGASDTAEAEVRLELTGSRAAFRQREVVATAVTVEPG
jgi:beta-glucosidase